MRFTRFLEFLSISFSTRLQPLKLISWGPIYSCEVVTMPKDHGRRLWCDNGTCQGCQSISEPQNHCHWHPLTSSDSISTHLRSSHSTPFLSIASFWHGFSAAVNTYEWLCTCWHNASQALPRVEPMCRRLGHPAVNAKCWTRKFYRIIYLFISQLITWAWGRRHSSCPDMKDCETSHMSLFGSS